MLWQLRWWPDVHLMAAHHLIAHLLKFLTSKNGLLVNRTSRTTAGLALRTPSRASVILYVKDAINFTHVRLATAAQAVPAAIKLPKIIETALSIIILA
ncbi:hypothetical protein QA640_37850 [Bradyrhizobium sp. CB82]|uniref:hypothetical protein n=1 Tax=Bradyrhizobium sp. CB82 TaxID=3039159 RepID=UPI0024B064A4|nr:hypothetical protein [Bradyrhizobium sp. CB82]WFU39977.1 hypothetical protein QA640_37850 [Bradyrhizobium sp. CB82]